jgi:hypothetical protein
MSIAAKVAAVKAAHPEQFCKHPRCLWRVKSGRDGRDLEPCRRHPVNPNTQEATQ